MECNGKLWCQEEHIIVWTRNSKYLQFSMQTHSHVGEAGTTLTMDLVGHDELMTHLHYKKSSVGIIRIPYGIKSSKPTSAQVTIRFICILRMSCTKISCTNQNRSAPRVHDKLFNHNLNTFYIRCFHWRNSIQCLSRNQKMTMWRSSTLHNQSRRQADRPCMNDFNMIEKLMMGTSSPIVRIASFFQTTY